MSKKLVKAAKRQFEERLCELGNHAPEIVNGETFYSGIDKQGNFHILRIGDADVEYSEFDYGCPLLELYDNEEFLDKIAAEFAIGRSGIKPILKWWSDAEKNNEPFDMADIVQFAPVKKFVEFEDIYEEVPDVRIITAKEQWEKASKGAEVVQELENGSIYKVAVTDGSITFFVCQDGEEYFREIYPSFDELRKDASFVTAYLSHVQSTHDTDLDAALAWLRGGEYTMSKVSLLDIYDTWEAVDHLCYHDKEEPTGVVKQDFKEELDALRKKMVAHIEQLCEQGMTVNVDSLTKCIALGWEDNSFVYSEDIKDLFLKKTENKEWVFCYTSYSSGRSDEYPFKYLSIETLKLFIEAMQ